MRRTASNGLTGRPSEQSTEEDDRRNKQGDNEQNPTKVKCNRDDAGKPVHRTRTRDCFSVRRLVSLFSFEAFGAFGRGRFFLVVTPERVGGFE
jgi:hypothetical protein